MSFKSKILAAVLAAAMIVTMAGCKDGGDSSGNASSGNAGSTLKVSLPDETEMFSEADFKTAVSEAATKVTLDGTTLTIGKAGEYIITDSIENGQIVVDADKNAEVVLHLNGVSISSQSCAAIYVKKAEKVTVNLLEGSENTLIVKGEFAADGDTNVDGAIFSKSDLTVNGTGSLKITTEYDHGIVSKDNLIITGGSFDIDVAGHALSGKDSVRIAGGSFTLSCEKDGVHAENVDDTSLGYYYCSGGSFDMTCMGDGIDASGVVTVAGGNYNIKAGGGASEGSKAVEGGFGFYDRYVDSTDTASTKGIKADADLVISGGSFNIDSADDGIHSNGAVTVLDGSFEIASGDDAIHAETDLTVGGGYINITESYEGLEGNTVTVSGGEISLVASDDGINAAGGNDRSGFGGAMRPDSFGSSSDSFVKITGGRLNINASGDGVDSNGELIVTGGETYVSGPTNSGNGALDYGSSATVSGGVFMAAGASGMATNFTSASGQGAMMVNIGTVQANQELSVYNSDGNKILSHTFEKAYNCIVITSPDIQKGETYTIRVGSISEEVEMTSEIYGSSGGMGGFGGMGGGMGGPGGMHGRR